MSWGIEAISKLRTNPLCYILLLPSSPNVLEGHRHASIPQNCRHSERRGLGKWENSLIPLRTSLRNAQLVVWGILAMASVQFAATAQNTAPAPQPKRFEFGSLIQVVAPSTPLKLAEKAEISLILHDKGLASVVATQNRYLDSEHKFFDAYGICGGNQSFPFSIPHTEAPILCWLPQRLGEVELTVFGNFPNRVTDRCRLSDMLCRPNGNQPR